MSAELATLLQAIFNLLAVVVAGLSIAIALRTEVRNRDRFQSGLDLSRELASASIRPLLSVYSQIGVETKSVILVNRGIGPAVVTSFEMKRGEKSVENLSDLFDIGDHCEFRKLPREKIFISPGQEIILVRLAKQYLIAHGCTEKDADKLLVSWQQQKRGIEVRFNYEDALGKIQDSYTTTLV